MSVDHHIAIIGMAGRFPQSRDIAAFRDLIMHGTEAIEPFSEAQLTSAGVPDDLLRHPDYVKSGVVIPELDQFDADFFGMSQRDAEIADPQLRVFLESAYHALEQAGYPAGGTRTGVFAGMGANRYLDMYLKPRFAELLAAVGGYRLLTLNDKDFIATFTAYQLNLRGPAITVQTACSTSLTAVHVACQSLLNVECDLALAGGVTLPVPPHQGYLYQEGMITSPDGHCRAFDAEAKGMVGGAGCGIVVLKRLTDAIADHDTIAAVIRGSAVNNDGSDKMGFTAPSVSGQSEVILEAQAVAEVTPDQISYVEAHGTGTTLGDPIEMQALTQAFRTGTDRHQFCALGSVKTNIGHADAAAGVAGLIKTTLALQHQELPASLHFKQPNPQIDFANSPFFVNAERRPWQVPDGQVRCAGVSSFGIGGTNAHVIVQEAPPPAATDPSVRPHQLLVLSAKTTEALDQATDNLRTHLQQEPHDVADVAYTLSCGREAFRYRRCVVAQDSQDAITQLADCSADTTQHSHNRTLNIAFLLPGQGAQHPGMTEKLYQTEPTFRQTIDTCADLLQPHLQRDIRTILYPTDTTDDIHQTCYTQPTLFVVEYALAQLWISWGVQPTAFLGHSIGEYVAACLAGVINLADALGLIALRGRLMQSVPGGDLLAVPLTETEAKTWCSDTVSLAVINAPKRCVLAGDPDAIAQVKDALRADGIKGTVLHTSHAFHSHMLEPILPAFADYLRTIELHAPHTPYLSNLRGDWITPEDATSVDYWVGHLRHTVRFADNAARLAAGSVDIALEVGPGRVLSTLIRQNPATPATCTLLHSLPDRKSKTAESQHLLHTLGQIWLQGAPIDWTAVYTHERRRRVPLPGYPFARQRYWLDRPEQTPEVAPNQSATIPVPDQSTLTTNPEPPTADDLYQALAELWRNSLGTEVITTDTDFFAAGGDSLLATQLIAQVNATFHIKLDTHVLLQAATPGQLAQHITSAQHVTSSVAANTSRAALSDLIVPLQTGDPAHPPLVLLYPVGGHVYFYRELAQHLDPQQPVYGIRAPGAEGEAPLLTTLEAMAEASLAALQTLQSDGPYYLGGASFGGILAYAMAQKLRSAGASIAYLGMIDAPGPDHMPIAFSDDAEILFYLLTVGAGQTITLEELRRLDPEQQLSKMLQLTGQDDTAAARTALARTLQLFHTNLGAMLDYQPTPYAGKVHFYLAAERDAFNAQTPAQAWVPLAQGGIQIHTLPGNHISMNTAPHVQSLATCLQNHLKECSLQV